MTNVGKLEHIKAILNEYDKSIKQSEELYMLSLRAYSTALFLGAEELEMPDNPNEHSIEIQATTAMEKIKGFLS